MIAHFPDTATLITAVRRGAIPNTLLRAEVVAWRSPTGALWVVAPDLCITPSSTLATLGVQQVATAPCDAWQTYPCWAALVPPEPVRAPATPSVVLLHTADSTTFTHLLTTLRQLHCVGVSFACLGTSATPTYLIRAVQPPSLVLYALEGSAQATAYVEHSPNLWIAWGMRHPLIDAIPAGKRKWLLLAADGSWNAFATPLLQPLDARHPLVLPAHAEPAPTHTALPSLPTPSKLRAMPTAEAPTLWVLGEDCVAQLQAFVDDGDGRLLDELDFALATAADAITRLVVRARRSRRGPPALTGLGTPYISLLKLPHTYIPAGHTLQPPLRRDAVREWLCQPNQVTWLAPTGQGRYTVETIPADAFRPLPEWVEYTHAPRTTLVMRQPRTALFKLEPFTAIEEAKPKAKTGGRDRQTAAVDLPTLTTLPNVIKGKAPPKARQLPPLEEYNNEPIPLPEALQQLHALENEFLALTGPIDDPARQALWPRLAISALRAGQDDDAGICWGNALWEHESAEAVTRWFREEQRQATNLPALLKQVEPRLCEVRAIAAWLAHATVEPAAAQALRPYLSQIGVFLDTHDYRLPVRIAWLAWVALAKLSGGDVLALTRARDRIMGDLLDHGLRRDRDLPAFLRLGAARHSVQQHIDLDRFLRLADYASGWCSGRSMQLTRPGDPVERAYVGLIFAFALAKFGDHEGARLLLADVGTPTAPGRAYRSKTRHLTDGQEWIWNSYRERVERQLNGEIATAPLSLDQRRALGDLKGVERTLAEQFLQFSRILEPFERVDPYRHFRQYAHDSLAYRLAQLTATPVMRKKRDTMTEHLEQSFRSLFNEYRAPGDAELLLHSALPHSVRIGESFALDCIARVEPLLRQRFQADDIWDRVRQVEILEAALGVAAHLGRTALLPPLLDVLDEWLGTLKGDKAAWVIAAMNAGSIRFLCRLGLAEVAKRLLARMTTALTGDVPLDEFLKRSINRGIVCPALLRLSGGWFYFNNDAPAQLTLATVREELLIASASHEPRSKLAAAYALALGHAPVKQALGAYFDLFEHLPAPTIMDMRMPVYTIQRLRVVEAVAMALAAEDFAVDGNTRRWLDEDEYMIRRRIHRDVATALSNAGL